MFDDPSCPTCAADLEAASLPHGGRVGWWCERCYALYPDGAWVNMRDVEVE